MCLLFTLGLLLSPHTVPEHGRHSPRMAGQPVADDRLNGMISIGMRAPSTTVKRLGEKAASAFWIEPHCN